MFVFMAWQTCRYAFFKTSPEMVFKQPFGQQRANNKIIKEMATLRFNNSFKNYGMNLGLSYCVVQCWFRIWRVWGRHRKRQTGQLGRCGLCSPVEPRQSCQSPAWKDKNEAVIKEERCRVCSSFVYIVGI